MSQSPRRTPSDDIHPCHTVRGMLVAFLLWTAVFAQAIHGGDSIPSRDVATGQLAQAEAAVAEAAKLGALWTTAREALDAARKAYAEGDFGSSLRYSTTAVEQARLGIAQLGFPPLRY